MQRRLHFFSPGGDIALRAHKITRNKGETQLECEGPVHKRGPPGGEVAARPLSKEKDLWLCLRLCSKGQPLWLSAPVPSAPSRLTLKLSLMIITSSPLPRTAKPMLTTRSSVVTAASSASRPLPTSCSGGSPTILSRRA